MTASMRVVALDGSPHGGGKTAAALSRVLAGSKAGGAAETVTLGIAGGDADELVDAVEAADGLVLGTPVYRASLASPLKALLDQMPRAAYGETRAPLTGKAVAIVATGASFHHFLALNDLRNVLAGFFAAHVVPPGLYVPREGFGDEGLIDPYDSKADRQGRALVELAAALRTSEALRGLEPQA